MSINSGYWVLSTHHVALTSGAIIDTGLTPSAMRHAIACGPGCQSTSTSIRQS
jgi:hypothetical protein